MKKGFTLLELIVVIVILGILATLGFTQYTKMVEKGRTAEAKVTLGQIRSAQMAYYQEYGTYTPTFSLLIVDAPTSCTGTTNYFSYASDATTSTATRCTSGSGKPPGAVTAYSITLSHVGVLGGSAGYY